MSELRRRYCVFGCDITLSRGVPLHRFPNPEKQPDLFAAWVTVVGDKLTEKNSLKIYKNKRICDYHFDPKDKTTGGRLIFSAMPTVHLKCVPASLKTFVERDHSYCHHTREGVQSRSLVDITNMPGTSSSKSSTAGLSRNEPIHISNYSMSGVSSGSTSSTVEIPKFDAGKTSSFLQTVIEKKGIRKVRQMEGEIRRLRQKVKRFKLQLQQVKNLSAKRNFEKLAQHMTETARHFTRMQYIEGLKKKKGRRFTFEEKILALSIFKKSPKCYNFMCKHFTLPSRKLLKSLLTVIKLSPGINSIIFKELKSTVARMLRQDRICTLIFDEMSISPHINYNVYTDDLVGFENYGTEKTANFANHVLVFMVKGIKKNFKQPVAYYFTQSLKTTKLKEILIDVITNVQSTGLNIIATICDQSTVNVSTINALISDTKSMFIHEGKEWRKDIIRINNADIIPLFDIPHLIKGIRNNLLTKEMQYMHENTTKTVNWEYFQRVFEADKLHGELCILPKLTKEHIDPNKIRKMRVKNAVQVLSHSMAVAIDNLAARGDIIPECRDLIPFVLLIDKLFDSFNASCFIIPNGKIYRAAVKNHSPHHQLWQEALKMLKTVKFFVNRNDGGKIKKSVPTINNLIKTIEGFKSVWQLLSKKYSFDAMLTRNLNQDPLGTSLGVFGV